WLMMSLWDALRMNMMISYQELVRTFPSETMPVKGLSSTTSGEVEYIAINDYGGTEKIVSKVTK
ncbi:hypothetical protein OGY16_20070, partial [Citrobacter sp. Cpo131]|nr:hypothetical protein [Citrobacter sp. Cpo131]MDM2890401.1 hypothetical protein [Citrobacter sp. Cpo060]